MKDKQKQTRNLRKQTLETTNQKFLLATPVNRHQRKLKTDLTKRLFEKLKKPERTWKSAQFFQKATFSPCI